MENLGTDIFLNTEFQKARRLEMLKGIRHASCSACWLAEDAGMQSLRTENQWYPDPWRKKGNPSRFYRAFHADSVLTNPLTKEEITPAGAAENSSILRSERPSLLEINLGNTCDLKCSYCGPDFSSKWEGESDLWAVGSGVQSGRKKKEIDPRFEALFWEWFSEGAIYSVSRIGIIGGEPLLNPRLPEFLEKLVAAYEKVPLRERPHSGHIDSQGKIIADHKPLIWIVTNLNFPEKFMDRLCREILPGILGTFRVEIHASLESTGPRAEYSRFGLNWELFRRNADQLCGLDLPGFTFGFQAAINALSVSSLPEFLTYAWSLHEKHSRPILLKQNIVTNPQNHHPAILTKDFSSYLDEAITFLDSVKEKMPPVADELSNWSSYAEFLRSIRESIRNESGRDMKWDSGSLENVRKNFHRFFRMYDEKRATKFTEVFPEYAEFYRTCGK